MSASLPPVRDQRHRPSTLFHLGEPHRQAILDLARRHGARNVRVFGSIVRGEDGPQSDVDFLVEVEPGRTLLDLIAFGQDLETLLGRRVDVLTDAGLSPYLHDRITTEATAL